MFYEGDLAKTSSNISCMSDCDDSPATHLVAAVQLGVGLLYERHPELARVGAPRVAVGAVTLGQPAVTRGNRDT